MANLRVVLIRSLFVCITVLFSAHFAMASEGKRIALVIGNSAYMNVPKLPNPVNDANAMAAALSRLKFDVYAYDNLDLSGMRSAIKKFSKKSKGAEIALVYYAGHGMEMNGRNYLIPVDAVLTADTDVDFETLPLDMIVGSLNSNAQLKIVLLDACRNNPFLPTMERSVASRSISYGLAPAEAIDGTLISYSAREGHVAKDGAGDHSPYTQALLDTIEKPGVELNLMFRIVRDEVLESTDKEQEPYFYASLPGRSVYLKQPQEETSGVAVDWENVKTTTDPEVLKEFIRKYPQDILYRKLAEDRLSTLAKIAALPEKPPLLQPQTTEITTTPKTDDLSVSLVAGMSGKPARNGKGFVVKIVPGNSGFRTLRKGDTVLQVNYVNVHSIDDINRQIETAQFEGRSNVAFFIRSPKGALRSIFVQLSTGGNLDINASGARREEIKVDGNTTLSGVQSADGTKFIAVGVSPHSVLSALRMGDRITSIDNRDVRSADDIRKVLADARSDGRYNIAIQAESRDGTLRKIFLALQLP